MAILFSSDTWSEILSAIGKNKFRTLVTVTGVLWGIFIYILLSGAAKGLDNGFKIIFQDVAKNSLVVWGGFTSIPYSGYGNGRWISLKYSDIDVLKSKIEEIRFISPQSVRGMWGTDPAKVVIGQKYGQYNIYGSDPTSAKITNKKIFTGGRFINDIDMRDSRKVVTIGERTQSELFGKDNPIGKFIRVDGTYFKVIGLMKYERGGGFNTDGDIHIPFSTFRKLYNIGNRVGSISIAAYDDADIKEIEEKVKTILREHHRVDPSDARAFGAFNFGELFTRIEGFSKGLTLLSLIVGIATVFAGVIGIGNILLISVKERTSELGIRRAMGATPGQIRGQILLESITLTLIAGIVGMVLGTLILAAFNNVTQNLELDFPYANPTVPPLYVMGALLIMIVFGALIGLIPAQRALSIRPIDALREE